MPLNHLLLLSLLSLALCACGRTEAPQKPPPNLPLVTTAEVQSQPLEITEEAVGSLEGLIDPTLGAEIAARVVKVHVGVGDRVKKGQLIATLDVSDFNMQLKEAETEVSRIKAQLENQQKIVARNQTLVDRKFISQNAVDTAQSERDVLTQQLNGAYARISTIKQNSSKTRIYTPTDGIIEKKIVDSGEFLKAGDPIVQIVGNQKLRAHIPFPESIAAKIQPGQVLKLRTPTSDKTVTTTVKEIKPVVMADNRAVDVIADINNQPGWKAGASVNASIILSQQDNTLVVPEQSIVLRPAGEVAYVIENDTAYQHIVQTGNRSNGAVEILSGLQAGQIVAVDGAAYLTDKARIKIAPSAQ
ncbi:MAG: efflux RND transporter periplasmic adaptor subunit [Betaproteobacteria bacterium HGW-Betaproteobacteria-22]|nr:MAG: efflux RND transporter periplasmic adaptor subunit [Betaproteobacteria bacterium HGW-Betaproteobacteria-22]